MEQRFFFSKQTPEEFLFDKKRLKRLKRAIEKDIPNTTVHIDECSQWQTVWRIPFTFQQATVSIRDSHFKIAASHGAELCVEEIFSTDQTHVCILEMRKTVFRFRGWSIAERFLFFTSILGASFCLYRLWQDVVPLALSVGQIV